MSQNVSFFVFDRNAEINLPMSSNLIGLKEKTFTNQATLNTRRIKLNEFQVLVNWEIVNIKLVPSITVQVC